MKGRIGLCVTLMAALTYAADPAIGYVWPAGMQAGTTNRLIVGGQGFFGIMSAGVTGKGVHILKVERMVHSAPPMGAQGAWLRKWLDGIILRHDYTRPAYPTNGVDGWTVNGWWHTLDKLDRRALEAVERDIFVRKNQLQMSPSLRQILFVDVAVDADAEPGARAFTVWTTSGISAPRTFTITREMRVEEKPYTPPHRKVEAAPILCDFPAVLDGRIFPGETDRFRLVLPAGQFLTCKVQARSLQPYIGDAVPGFFNPVVRLVDAAGKEVAFADDRARFDPDPELRAHIPDDGTYTLEIHDNLYRGRDDFVYAAYLSLTNEAQVAAAQDHPLTPTPAWYAPWTWGARTLALGHPVQGTIQPGVADTYKVTLTGPGTFLFDVHARRQGSSLDAVLTLRDSADRVIWRQDDVTNTLFVGSVAQGECDAAGRISLAADETRTYSLTVEDLTGHGGADYFYTLSVQREQPDFAVYATRSAFLSRRGSRQPFTLHVVRTGGFTGPVTLLENANYRFEGGYVPAHTNKAQVTLVGTLNDEQPLAAIRLKAFGEPGGKAKVVDVVPTDVSVQAFAWTHLVPAPTFLLKNMLPYPPRVMTIKPADTLVLTGFAIPEQLARDLRLFWHLRRPFGMPDVAIATNLPAGKPPAGMRPLLLTPVPADEYGVLSCTALNTTYARQAAELRALGSVRGVPLVDLHDALTPILRERVPLKLCGTDGHTFTPEMRLLALTRLCEALGENAEFVSMRLDVTRPKEDVQRAHLRDVALTPKGGSFTYTTRFLPLPLTAAYRRVDKVYPLTQRLNREMLFIAKLATGRYQLDMDGRKVGVFSASEFAKGINLALLDTPNQRRAQTLARTWETAAKVSRPYTTRVTITPVRK